MYYGDRHERMAAQCTLPWCALEASDSAKTAAATVDCSEASSMTVTVGLVSAFVILTVETVQFLSCLDMNVSISILLHFQIVLAYIFHILPYGLM